MNYLMIILSNERKIDLCLVKYDRILKIFNEDFTPLIKSESESILEIFHLKKFLLFWIECFIERGHIFSHKLEMNNTTFNPL